jgi:hypothetical protein
MWAFNANPKLAPHAEAEKAETVKKTSSFPAAF